RRALCRHPARRTFSVDPESASPGLAGENSMRDLQRLVVFLGVPLVVVCGACGGEGSGGEGEAAAVAASTALTPAAVARGLTRPATEAALAGIAPNGTECRDLAL